MTPQETSDYKLRWMRDSKHNVRLHSDLAVEGKDWCRKNLQRHQWSFTSWTRVYEHTFHFEDAAASQRFEHAFGEWVQK